MGLCCYQNQLRSMLSKEQQLAFDTICTFLNSNDHQVLILRGSAGTGKTTLLGEVVQYLKSERLPFYLMAPTGRAAHILQTKTNVDASTIHRGIYNLSEMEFAIVDEDLAKSDFKFHYPIRVCDESNPIVIVDEGSMVGNRRSEGELWSFGTNQLLNDLITFSKLNEGGKLVIVGDPVQLPPVMETVSSALQEQYFVDLGYQVVVCHLNEVHRQQADSILLDRATHIRTQYESGRFNQLDIAYSDEIVPLMSTDVATEYTRLHSYPQIGSSVVICYSNATANFYNEQIRHNYFANSVSHIQEQDVLMVVNNHYDTRNIEDIPGNGKHQDIMNGEFVQLLDWSNEETRTIPVYENGERIHVDITFVDAEMLLQTGEKYYCKIITDPVLSAPRGTVSITLIRALYIDFCMRNPELRKNRKKNPEAFSKALKSDPYINALRVRYGYAITCHKSQGGEWDNVFIDFEGVHFDRNGSRWMYTALTRAREHVYMINFSNVSPTQDLVIQGISRSIQQHRYFPNPQVPISVESPYHDVDAPAYIKSKYSEIVQILENSEFYISNVQSFPYRERYSITSAMGITHTVDFMYNGKGQFKQPAIANESLRALIESGSQDVLVYPSLSYEPTNHTMQYLFDIMLSACDKASVDIVNVVEDLQHYQVVYCLKTSAKFAWITFYVNNRGFITYGDPHSECVEDEKLNYLLGYLQRGEY